MDLSFSPEHLAFRDEVREFIRTAMPPHLQAKAAVDGHFEMDEVMEWHKILYKKGWVAPHWPAEHGGPKLDVAGRFILTEELELSGAPTLSPFGLTMVGPLLIQFGTEAQKQRILKPMARSYCSPAVAPLGCWPTTMRIVSTGLTG